MVLNIKHRVKILGAVGTDKRFFVIMTFNVSLKVFLTSREIGLVVMNPTNLTSSVVWVRVQRLQSVSELCVSGQVEAEVRQVCSFVGAISAAVLDGDRGWGDGV